MHPTEPTTTKQHVMRGWAGYWQPILHGLFGLIVFFLLWYLLVEVFAVWRFKQLPQLVSSVQEWLSPNPVYGAPRR